MKSCFVYVPIPEVRAFASQGGEDPIANQIVRSRRMLRLFSCRASTVARPLRVRPSIACCSISHRKCRDQRWRRG